MTRYRMLVAYVAAGLAIALTMSLGNWQLRRADEKRALQAAWDAAVQAPPIEASGPRIAEIGGHLPRNVVARGRFLFDHEVWLDNRQMDGQAGLLLLTPLRLADGAVIVVNRGFAARDPVNRSRLPSVTRPDGEVTLEGLAVAHPPRVLQLGDGSPIGGAGPFVWQNFDFDVFERASGLVVARWTIQQRSNDGDGLRREWSQQNAGVDKHLGYAVQWFSLAGLLAMLTLYFGGRSLLRRPASAGTGQ